MQLDTLVQKISDYSPHADLSPVEKAYRFAQEVHQGQYRESGEPYFAHPYEVAKILVDLELDVTTIAAGLLHDVLEDTSVSREELADMFGDEICRLVDGVTKLSRMSFRTQEEHQAHSLRKMFLAMAEDLRVVLIKLADRLHNMRTLRHLPPERQKKIANETLEIYTPLAHRLGIWGIKWEMEDLALRYLKPDEYYGLVRKVARQRRDREGELEEVISNLRQRLEEVGIAAEIYGRPKHFYSIYQKMQEQHKDFDEIYDLLAIRAIVDSVKDCYGVLGIVHTLWKPVPGRFKDYIAMPKSNMYQSLHTTVIGPKGDPFEVQIRTWEMNRIAEKGIAAHWLYKEGARERSDFDQKVAWLRQVMDWLREMKDPHEFMETLKIDLFEDEVFVFTPKGDVKNLPAGSTPVDFAFSVHTDIGYRCVGAKVNGRIVPLDYRLRNGEFVEILTSKTASPSRDWLNFVKTSKARNKIRAWVKEEMREENVLRGRVHLEKEARKAGVELNKVFDEERMADVAHRYGLGGIDDLLEAIGFGRITAKQVLSKLIGKEDEARPKPKAVPKDRTQSPDGIRVKGVPNLLIRFSKCCNPVPGDQIVGYITRGRGVSVHRTDCPNLQALQKETDRQIAVEWDTQRAASYPVEIHVEAIDRVSLLSNIMNTITEGQARIEAVNARTSKRHQALIDLVVDINDIEHMNNVIKRIKRVDGVVSVRRANPT